MEEAMSAFKAMIATSILCSLPTGTVFAQADQTGTGGGPLSAEKAPNTTSVGQTKPPSRDASPTSIKPIKRVAPRQAADDAITTRICIGCGGEPSTTGSLPTAPMRAGSPERRDGQLNELRTAAEPKKQSDLDTFALASAQRERAESVQEKTNGLWQSWLVSACNGCGDQKPAKAWKLEDWPRRDASLTTGSIDRKAFPEMAHHAEAKRAEVRHRGSLEADVSPEKVDSIRRMPQQ
jgi:hypothetical protein